MSEINLRIAKINRKRIIRKLCYAMKQGVKPSGEIEKGLVKKIENLDGFFGWDEFAETWDISADALLKDINYLEITELRHSLAEEWDADVRKHALDFVRK